MPSFLLHLRRAIASSKRFQMLVSAVVIVLVGSTAWMTRALAAPLEQLPRSLPDVAAKAVEAVDAVADPPPSEPDTATRLVGDQCVPPSDTPIPAMVAEIFRCRLEGSLSTDELRTVAAEAVVVARCESEFDPDVIVFDGRYVDQPHPMTGMYYTAAGIFQFIRATADEYMAGGYAAATDPVTNINAAVDLYLDNRANGGRGWESWECSAVNGAFKTASVLPGWPGGPDRLPAWAFAV